MLEVHPPHHTPNTWRDFLIHIATICVGLLIAVGLEQTVEAIHHRHQREELQAALDRDTQQSIHDGHALERIIEAENLWLHERAGQVRMALDTGAFASGQHPSPGLSGDVPSDGAWRSAKAAGLSQLVSQDDVRAYEEVDAICAGLVHQAGASFEAFGRRENFEEQFRYEDKARWPDAAPTKPEDLRRYLDLLNDESAANQTLLSFTKLAVGADIAIARGERNLSEIEKSEKTQ